MKKLLTSLTLIAVFALPQISSALDFNAVQNPDGSVDILSAEQPVATFGFNLYRNGWGHAGWSASARSADGSYNKESGLPGGKITANSKVTLAGDTFTVRLAVTPTVGFQCDSGHMRFTLAAPYWAGTSVKGNDNLRVLPKRLDHTVWFQDWARSFQMIHPDGSQIDITGGDQRLWLVQDSRNYNAGYEVRIYDVFGYWPANTTKYFNFTMKVNRPASLTEYVPVTINPSSEWIPMTASSTFLQGSALDWTPAVPEVAGSKGWLKANAKGEFYFEKAPYVPVRFVGANIAQWGCFPDKAQAELMATNLARMGYNAVRLHHYDHILTEYGSNSTTFDVGRLDRLNYLVSALKRRGIYVKIDLFSLRNTRANEIIAGQTISPPDFKAVIFGSEAARANWFRFSQILMDTTNPYTGLKWKDDPAIAWVNLVNEDTPLWFRTEWMPGYIQNLLTAAQGGVTWNVTTDTGARRAVALARDVSNNLKGRLRGIGVKSLVTDFNVGNESALAIARKDLDFVDNHFYLGHPEFLGGNWTLPIRVPVTGSPLSRPELFGWFAASQLQGKPFMVSEYDAVAPNGYRGEFGLVMGAMAAVQKWDALFRFQWTDWLGNLESPDHVKLFTVLNDPAAMAAERAIVALFARGDLTSNSSGSPIQLAEANMGASELRGITATKNNFLVSPITLSPTIGEVNPNTDIPENAGSSTDGKVWVDLNRQEMRVATGLTAGVITSPGTEHVAGALTVRLEGSRASVWVTALDRKSLFSSTRMLLTHVTDVQNTGTSFTSQKKDVMTTWGVKPHLAKAGRAIVSLAVRSPETVRVYALDMSGRRLNQVPTTVTATGVKFRTDVLNPTTRQGCFYYEIVK